MKTIHYYLLLLVICLIPLGQLERITLGSTIAFYLHDIPLFILFITCIGSVFSKRNSVTKPLLIFFGISLFSLIVASFKLSSVDVLIGFLYWARFVVYSFGISISVFQLSETYKKTLRNTLIGSGFVLAVLGWVQYFLYPDLRNLVYLGWDPHLNRIFSTLLDPNFTGIHLVVTFLLVVSQFKFLALFLFITTLFTYSRASYSAFLTGSILIFNQSGKVLFLIALGFVVGVFLLPKTVGEGVNLARSSTVISRIENWKEAFTVFKTNPIFGTGFNTYHAYRMPIGSRGGTDNSFLFVLATTGIIGLFSYLFLLGSMTMKSSLVFRSIFLSIIVHSVFNNTLFYPSIMIWLFMLWGVDSTQKNT